MSIKSSETSLSINKPDANVESKSDIDEFCKPPADSLYGWVVVSASFMLMMLYTGSMNTYGVYLDEYHRSIFPSTSASTLTWIGSLQFGTTCCFTVLAGVLVERYDPRIIVTMGSMITGLSFLLASLCSNAIELVFTQGILFGLGGAFIVMPAMGMPAQWIAKYKGLATNIAAAGGAVGGVWLSFATRSMIASMGWRWSLRITGFITIVVGLVAGPLMRRRIRIAKREKILDLDALKNLRFLLLFFGCLFSSGGYYMPFYFMPSYAVSSLGIAEVWSSNISSILSGSGIAGRLVIGMLADQIGPLNTLVLCAFSSALSVFVLWLPFHNVHVLVAAAAVFGFTSSGLITLAPPIIATLFGIKRLPSILGLLFFSYTLGMFVSAPVGGALLDMYEEGRGYMPVIVYSGIVLLSASLLLGVLRAMLSARLFKAY